MTHSNLPLDPNDNWAAPDLPSGEADIRQTHGVLASVFFRAGCPTSNLLLDFALGLSTDSERKHIDDHLTLCRHCQQEMAYLDAVETDASPSTAGVGQLWERLRRLLPDRPILPAWPQAPQTGLALRGDGQSQDQSRVYLADRYRLSLTVALSGATSFAAASSGAESPGAESPTAPNSPLMTGTVIEGSIIDQSDPAAALEGRAILLSTADLVQEVALDEFGYFTMTVTDANVDTLLVELPNHSIWVQELIP